MTQPVNWTIGTTPLYADDTAVTWGGRTIRLEDIDGWAHLLTKQVRRMNGVVTGKTTSLCFRVTAGTNIIDVRSSASGQSRKNAAGHEQLERVAQQLWSYGVEAIAPRLISRLVVQVIQGGEVRVGSLTVRQDGISIQRPLRGLRTIPFSDYAETRLAKGRAFVRANKNGKVRRADTLKLDLTNACVIGPVLNNLRDYFAANGGSETKTSADAPAPSPSSASSSNWWISTGGPSA
jgi:hypothetical protein